MTKKNIPTPICSTCGESGGTHHTGGDTFYLCPNCGTEMKYLPPGGMLLAGGNEVKKNNGWITTFSMYSAEVTTGRLMFGVGLLMLVLAFSFLFLHKIGSESALWSAGSGIVLIILGARKSMRQMKKMQIARERYTYWKE